MRQMNLLVQVGDLVVVDPSSTSGTLGMVDQARFVNVCDNGPGGLSQCNYVVINLRCPLFEVQIMGNHICCVWPCCK